MGSRSVLVAAVALSIIGSAVPGAAAEDAGGYADWSMTGGGHAYTGTMTLPGDFPAATFTSDARAASRLNSGGGTWIPGDTPFGEVFGDSRGRPYPNLRPHADRPGAPSTTTFTFDSATPDEGWGFVLGDIDADSVEVSATDAAGAPVPVVNLGFQSVFNYCDASPRSNACSGVTSFHTPTWKPGASSGVLAGDGDDEVGGAGWFRPTAAVKTLTFTFTRLSGFPVYQLWFARLPGPDEPTDPSGDPSGDPSTDPSGDPGDDVTDEPESPSGGASPDTRPGGVANGGGGPSLPVTGAEPLPVAGIGLALIVAGAAIVWTLRRRCP